MVAYTRPWASLASATSMTTPRARCPQLANCAGVASTRSPRRRRTAAVIRRRVEPERPASPSGDAGLDLDRQADPGAAGWKSAPTPTAAKSRRGLPRVKLQYVDRPELHRVRLRPD